MSIFPTASKVTCWAWRTVAVRFYNAADLWNLSWIVTLILSVIHDHAKLNKFNPPSEDCCCAGTIDEGQHFETNHNVFCWLLGRNANVKLGLCCDLRGSGYPNSYELPAVWLQSAMLPNLCSNLVVLVIHVTPSIWTVLFELQALTELWLRIHGVPNIPEFVLPLDRKLPNLVGLVNCTAALSTVLVGTKMPELTSLELESCLLPDMTIFDMTPFSKLKQLNLEACTNLQVSHMFIQVIRHGMVCHQCRLVTAIVLMQLYCMPLMISTRDIRTRSKHTQ